MKIEYQMIRKADVDESIRAIVADLLGKQRKVQNGLFKKADRCQHICIASIDGAPIGMGAIKEKTASDFRREKANLPALSEAFELELGYFYTEPKHAGQGIASYVARLLLAKVPHENLMASTEIAANPAMVGILERNGFRLLGKPWKSDIHDDYLGLFLRFGAPDDNRNGKSHTKKSR